MAKKDNINNSNNSSNNNNSSLKYVVPAVLSIGAGAAFLMKKIRRKQTDVVTVTAEPAEYDPEEVREYIAETLCVAEISEQDWTTGDAKMVFAAVDANFNAVMTKNNITVDTPVWHGYIAKDSGDAEYILKAVKDSEEPIYMFWEEKTGFIFALHEGLNYLMKLICGMSSEDYEKQGPRYANYMGLLEVLIEKLNIELDEEKDLDDVLEEKILEEYFEKNIK